MKIKSDKNLLLILFIFLINCSPNQEEKNQFHESRALISTNNKFFYAKINNLFEVVAQQKNPISFEKISAFQLEGSKRTLIQIRPAGKKYIINPDTLGSIEINIDLGDRIEKKIIRVKPLEAVGRLGRYTANSESKIGISELKSNKGILAFIECCDINARCKIIEYEIMRIKENNPIERILNKGGRFEKKGKELVSKAESNDIYIFRKIHYRCPGADQLQRLQDMIFEIK